MIYPEIYSSGVKQAVLNNIEDDVLTRRINNKFIYNFNCFEEDYKTEYLTVNNQIYIGDKYFDINYLESMHSVDGKIGYKVECEHVSYRLIGDPEDKINRYANTGTPTAILTDLLTGTDFTVGTIDFTDSIVFAVNKQATKLEIILELCNSLGGEIDFSGFNIDILNSVGQNNGFQVRIKKNLSQIKKIVDNRGTLKTLYDINFVDLTESDYFVNAGLGNLENADIGDTIHIIDETMNIDITQEILEISKSAIKNKNVNCKITNTIDLINDDIYSNKINSVNKDEVIYGVKINNEVGIEIERSDKLARTKLNADEFRMQVGDGLGVYTDSLYFDPINERYIFTGRLEATDIVGGTIVIGSNFEVDSSGNLTAINAEFSGTITGSTINGTNITGGTITGTTFKTSASGKRIEISGNDFNSYNNSDQKEGLQIDSSKNFNALDFYIAGVLSATLQLSGTSYSIVNTIGNITVAADGNTIISSDNGDVELIPDSTGDVIVNGSSEFFGTVDFNGNTLLNIGGADSGSFTTTDGKTVTVTGGIVTSIV